jgi:hypothetical protein
MSVKSNIVNSVIVQGIAMKPTSPFISGIAFRTASFFELSNQPVNTILLIIIPKLFQNNGHRGGLSQSQLAIQTEQSAV